MLPPRGRALRRLLMVRLALVLLATFFPGARPVQYGLTPSDDEMPPPPPVVAVWDRGVDSRRRCSGVFVTPELVLTAASCVLSAPPSTLMEDVACAYGAEGCPLVEPGTLSVLSAAELPDQVHVAEVLDIELRYSDPRSMPRVCEGSSACGEGWDIAALRVRQLCPERRCIHPLPLSMREVSAGDTVRLVGAGVDGAAWSASGSGPALRYHDAPLGSTRSGQLLVLDPAGAHAAIGGPMGCAGDAGAPLLRYEPELEQHTTAEDALTVALASQQPGEFEEGGAGAAGVEQAVGAMRARGGWAVVGIHGRVADGACDANRKIENGEETPQHRGL